MADQIGENSTGVNLAEVVSGTSTVTSPRFPAGQTIRTDDGRTATYTLATAAGTTTIGATAFVAGDYHWVVA